MKQSAGHYFHVYNRGVSRQRIFMSSANYIYLLHRIKDLLPNSGVTFIAYCMMPNHYHFLLRAEIDNAVSLYIQRLYNGYSQAFNKQQNRSGSLFESRAKIRWVDQDEYLLHLVRYIHLNPVKAGLVKHPGDWEYSNYREWVGQRQGSLIDPEFVEGFFPCRKAYVEFVLQEISPEVERGLRDYYLD